LAGDISAWTELGWSPKTPAQFMNEAMRLWGHQFVYDREELHTLLHEAAFSTVSDQQWRQSAHAELRGLEMRLYNQDLILESTP
jgi:predicted SAM-dependent methyltransferase